METDFVKKGTNEEDMKGDLGKMENHHKIHCCHDEGCPDMCQDHKVPGDNEHEGKNEHTYLGEDDKQEKGEHSGEYPGFIRKLR